MSAIYRHRTLWRDCCAPGPLLETGIWRWVKVGLCSQGASWEKERNCRITDNVLRMNRNVWEIPGSFEAMAMDCSGRCSGGDQERVSWESDTWAGLWGMSSTILRGVWGGSSGRGTKRWRFREGPGVSDGTEHNRSQSIRESDKERYRWGLEIRGRILKNFEGTFIGLGFVPQHCGRINRVWSRLLKG